jgi:hypothetical protein
MTVFDVLIALLAVSGVLATVGLAAAVVRLRKPMRGRAQARFKLRKGLCSVSLR